MTWFIQFIAPQPSDEGGSATTSVSDRHPGNRKFVAILAGTCTNLHLLAPTCAKKNFAGQPQLFFDNGIAT
jgi:hypothetical protein